MVGEYQGDGAAVEFGRRLPESAAGRAHQTALSVDLLEHEAGFVIFA
ncbi:MULTISPECIES: hypothetical protein [Nocardia]|nr:hypothetical protein [Nocardia violaceofusca]